MENLNRITDYKRKYVHQKSNGKYYYPSSLPRVRNHFSQMVLMVICVLSFLIPVIQSENTYASVVLYSIGVTSLFICEYLYRLILIIEEQYHLNTRYNGSFRELIKNSVYIPNKANTIIIMSMLLNAFAFGSAEFRGSFGQFVHAYLLNHICYFFTSIFMLNKLLKMDSSILHLSLWISRNKGIDYGSGMAYSYYHGYLKLILSKIGSTDKNLKEGMKNYESNENIEFQMYKLFILIPKSLDCLVSLEDGAPEIECAKSLLEKQITRAGVKDRVYKNPVYKIKEDNKINYVVAEYATPLKTFKEVVQHSGQHSRIYQSLQNDIVLQFYITLKDILIENEELELCDLIYYEDKDSEGRLENVGKILLARIKQLKQKEKKTK